VFLSFVAFVAFQILKNLQNHQSEKALRSLAHTAVNICLFPPLFFFSALYYTDIASLLFVLLSHNAVLLTYQKHGQNVVLVLLQLFYGLGALLLRQTNVFWVAIFPAGIAALKMYQISGEPYQGTGFDVWVERRDIFTFYYRSNSNLDYLWAGYGMITSSLSLYKSLLVKVAIPTVLAMAFASFVIWNEGVVLGLSGTVIMSSF
jgi:alpha-1,2-glucosyltransferase